MVAISPLNYGGLFQTHPAARLMSFGASTNLPHTAITIYVIGGLHVYVGKVGKNLCTDGWKSWWVKGVGCGDMEEVLVKEEVVLEGREVVVDIRELV